MVLLTDDPAPARLVLTASDLDVLELTLGGAGELPTLSPGARADLGSATTVELVDAENTPLARSELGPQARTTGVIESLEPLRPLAAVPGLSGAADVRLRFADAAERHRGRAFVALRDVPTKLELELARAWSAEQEEAAPVWLVTVRRPRDASADPAHTTVRVLHELLADGTLPGTLLVLPDSRGAQVGVLLAAAAPGVGEVAAQLGARAVLDLESRRCARTQSVATDSSTDALAIALETAFPRQAVDALRPREHGSRGAVVLFSGLSGSGKSTVAKAFANRLENEGRAVVLLDGDESRQMLSAGLGFDRRSRDLNIERLGYVAAIASRLGGIAITAPIAPFAGARDGVRTRAEQVGAYLLVHVSTPLEICEARDRKGLYAKARAGEIGEFTGISSPYDVPEDADVTIDTSVLSVDEAVERVHEALMGMLAND